MPEEKKSLCKVSVEGGGDSSDMYLLCTACEGGHAGFDIALTDTENAWTGTVTEDELGHMAKKMKVNFDNFVTETLKALSRHNVGSLHFEYSMKEMAEDEFKFTWKKYLPQDKIRIQLGQVTLRLRDEACGVFKEITEHSIQEGAAVQERIKSLESDNQRLAAERAGALKRLEKAVQAKEEMESDLYSKFVVVVNEKKRKIRELRDELSDPGSTQVRSQKTKSEPAQTDHGQSDGEEDDDKSEDGHGSDYDTDEEKKNQDAPSPAKKVKASAKGGATSLLDTSDDLGLDLEENDSPVAATRRRGRRGVTKQTPSKAVIPKVPASEHKSKPARGSLKKSDSNTSHLSHNTSRSASDPEDLLADL